MSLDCDNADGAAMLGTCSVTPTVVLDISDVPTVEAVPDDWELLLNDGTLTDCADDISCELLVSVEAPRLLAVCIGALG